MSEAALVANGLTKVLHTLQARLIDLLNNELGNPVAATDCIGFGPQIDEGDLYFTSVISIYGARAVDDANPVSEGQPASWTDLPLESFW
jgi:hypothetical protein